MSPAWLQTFFHRDTSKINEACFESPRFFLKKYLLLQVYIFQTMSQTPMTPRNLTLPDPGPWNLVFGNLRLFFFVITKFVPDFSSAGF